VGLTYVLEKTYTVSYHVWLYYYSLSEDGHGFRPCLVLVLLTVAFTAYNPLRTLFIYKLLSRKLLNSEVCGNASGNGNSYFTVPNA